MEPLGVLSPFSPCFGRAKGARPHSENFPKGLWGDRWRLPEVNRAPSAFGSHDFTNAHHNLCPESASSHEGV